jgi:uncharacterized membrane protein YidH (DUF202 family)
MAPGGVLENAVQTLCCVRGSEKPWADGEDDGDQQLDFRHGSGGVPSEKKVSVPQKIDPKTFFANERTFLKWLSVSVMIGMMSVTLLSFGTTKSDGAELSGLILLPVSIGFMVYALFLYRQRSHRIYMREPMRYDDTRAPTVLVIVLMFALVSSAYFSLQRVAPRTEVFELPGFIRA